MRLHETRKVVSLNSFQELQIVAKSSWDLYNKSVYFFTL